MNQSLVFILLCGGVRGANARFDKLSLFIIMHIIGAVEGWREAEGMSIDTPGLAGIGIHAQIFVKKLVYVLR